MTNSATAEESYSDLIIEAFVNPIRSVAIIDDEYPTLNSFLNVELNKSRNFGVWARAEEPEEKQLKIENIERLNAITQMCQQKHKWSISIYDGKTPGFGFDQQAHEENLNHNDLLILDYHLDGDTADTGGIRARNILNSLSQNNHFNLVIVHTKGDGHSIESVFDDILKDFLKIEKHEFDIDEKTNNIIEEWLDENDPDGSDITAVNDSLDIKDLIKILTCKALKTNIRNPQHPFHYAQDDVRTLENGTGLSKSEVVSWLVLKELAKHQELQSGHSNSHLDWGYEADGNFIATGRVFITVVKKEKSEAAELLYDKLCLALTKQSATPMYLLMAKMRYELDERGLAQASDIINNRYAQAGWLFNLLDKSDNDPTQHEKAIDLHWEQLSTSSKRELVNFSKRMIDSLKTTNPDKRDIVKSFFRECVGNKDLALGNLNAYSCSRSVSNYHLTTGTILETENNELWLCLSPACDLVPKQRQNDWEDRIGLNYIAFKAVKLHNDNSQISTANNKANDNEYIFLNINGTLNHYKFSDGNPLWETFYANDLGIFNSDGIVKEINVNCLRIENFDEGAGDNTIVQIPALVIVNLKMKAIAELRYEYALNFLHKFGSNQTRVGLGFADKLW
ncbi:response regulator receiver domain [Shewanella sp. S1-49-MNA-CIBAN-0167]|uniref:response regulator receiver domain n=1 Tax=Shewanella sp. S1-49-MNA-CIBAN-0167 TaxID=3140468 RepID=UPI00331EA96D